MNYGGNMPDWHQYNSTQPIGSEVPPVGQNANHSPIFGPTISPRRLNGPNFSPEGLNKAQNEANFNPRNFQQSPNTLNGPNVPPENPPMGSAAQMSGCHGPYGPPNSRNTMIEGTGASLDSRNVPGSALNEAIGQRNHQISMNRPAAHLNCSTMNGSMGPMGQRSTPTSIQAPIPTNSRQGPGSYIPCKLPCCNPDPNISYQSWEKFGPYPPNVPYRDTGYQVDNRRFNNDFENREQLSTGAFTIDPRRNFPDYKYRKDPIIPRTYPHPSGVIQNYPIQNYNFPADYQKYPAYPTIKEYPRDSSTANPQNPAILKYQEQSVIVQQKYFSKQIQYQNGVTPKNIVPTSIGSNVISRAQNPYFNPQLARDFPRNYSESTSLANRGIQTPNPIHAAYPKYQMYQQKIAMQRFSMENHLQELTRIPGYQSHPKYQESILRYTELLRLQQNVDYQSTVQDPPKVVTSQINEEIPPINLQYDQNGMLINSNFVPAGYPNIQSPINLQNPKNLQSVSNTEVEPLNLQQSGQFKTQANIDNHVQDQGSSSLSRAELSRRNEQQYSIETDHSRVQKYEGESRNVPNSDEGRTSSMHQKDSREFADKPELDVRQFLANWDESEDEDGTNANLPDVVLSNSTSGLGAEYETTKTVPDNPDKPKNCSEPEDCRSRDDCGTFENTENGTKPPNSTDNQIYRSDLPPGDKNTEPVERDLNIYDPEKKPIRTGTVIQPTSSECENEISLHIMENSTNNRAVHGTMKLLCRETDSLNDSEDRELTDKMENDIIIKKEPPVEEQTITSIVEHIKTYDHEANTKISSSIEGMVKNNGDSRSSSERGSSENNKHYFDSDEDLSESDDSSSTDTDSMSSFINSPKTINGTEIHVDAQELSAIPASPKDNSEMLDSTNLQKQNSFASEESHNPDDISLPDLPTSECTPISTALNTPIHSDSEESLEPVIDLSTPANPIEIIQNSPMLSFTHSPIKMEPYEHLDENDLTEKISHDALDFEFQASNSCDNDYEKLTDVSSHTTEQYNIGQNEEDTFDSDCVEILSDKTEPKVQLHTCDVETNDDVIDNITDQNRFPFNKGIVMTTDNANTAVNTDHQPWPSVTVREHKHQIANNMAHQNAKSDSDKLENLSEMKDRLSMMSEVSKDNLKDDMADISGTKNDHSTNKWQTKCEMKNVEFESTENMTALNLVKDENKIKSDLIGNTDAANSEVVAKAIKSFPSNSNQQEDLKHLNQRECNSPIESEVTFSSAEHAGVENQSNFTGAINIPLIPGEDFEEPKMPVLPMEGNCLTKIIKNTSPITDLDVLGSDDEKLDKMDEIWIDVCGVETVSKVTDVNVDTYIECGDGSEREKSWTSKKKLRMLQKKGWKSLKNSIKPGNPNESFGKVYNDGQQRDSKNTTKKNSHLHESLIPETAQRESKPIDEDFQSAIISGSDNAAAISQEKYNFTKVPTITKVPKYNSFREDGKQSNDACLENNTPEILKCQEKEKNINDIATKLLENARLFEPELRKLEVQRKESSCGDNSRDGSKKRIKLLKEFRKVKNRVFAEKPEILSMESVDAAENSAVSSIATPEQCKKVDAEILEPHDRITTNQSPHTSTIESMVQRSDSWIMNSKNTVECRAIQTVNVNTEGTTSHTLSTDIPVPDENLKQISNDGVVASKNEDMLKECYTTVNIEDKITVEESNSIAGHNSFDTTVVSPIEEDINECAINLSKSSDDFKLLQTSGEKGCVTSDSHHSSKLEHMEIEEPIVIESEVCEETTCTKGKDESYIPSQFSCLEDGAACGKIVEEDDDTLEVNHVEPQNVTAGDRESTSTSSCTNSAVECTVEENNKLETDREPANTADHEGPEDLSSSPEIVDELAESSNNKEKVGDNICENCEESSSVCKIDDVEMNTFEPERHENCQPNGSIAIDEKESQNPADKAIDSEVTDNAENVQIDLDGSSTVNEKESMESIDSFDNTEERHLQSDSPEKEICIGNFDDSLQKTTDVPEGRVTLESYTESAENDVETSVLHQERKICQSSAVVEKFMGSEPIFDSECSIHVKHTFENLDLITPIHSESKIICHDLEIIKKPSVVNASVRKMQLRECTEAESSQDTNLKRISETEKKSNTVDATFEAFGLENSFNDFNNFDLAPNFSNTADTDQSSDWKYSKAYARFEDCERYKNPDNFVNPISTSLDTLDHLNTVPIYTTKDGKITYSPNPRFTYKALIMEAREREGYPTLREPYCGNSRAQEPSNYSKNQASFRKRKNSATYSYSGNYGKKHYSEYYEPREHGESSMKKLPEPSNRSYFSHSKYSQQSRDRNSQHFIPHYNDAEKKHSTDRIVQEKVASKYKNREGCTVLDEHNKRKNGMSDSSNSNIKKQYKQSSEPSPCNSTWSGSKRNLKCDQNSSGVAVPRSETNRTTDRKKNKDLGETIDNGKYINSSKNDNLSKVVQPAEKFTSIPDEKKHTTEPGANISPTKEELNISSDTVFVDKKHPDPTVKVLESSSPRTEVKPSNSQNSIEILDHQTNEDSIVKPEVFLPEWKDSCENLTVQRSNSCEMKILTEPVLDEIREVHNEKIKVTDLYYGVDDICPNTTSELNEKKPSDPNLADQKHAMPSMSVKSQIRNESLEESNGNQEKWNVDESLKDTENKDTSDPIPVQLIPTDKYADEQKIQATPEALDKPEAPASLNETAESTREEDEFDDPLPCTDEISSNCTKDPTMEVKDVHHEDLVDDEIRMDKHTEFPSLNLITEVQDSLVAPKSNDQILHSKENVGSIQETEQIERREPKIKSYKIKPEKKNGTSVKNLQQASNDSLSLKMISEYASRPQSQFENYIAYSPSNESSEDMKAIPKLVIKKADSSNCKNVYMGTSSATSNDGLADRISDKEEHSSKVPVHPKIPKILIRNAKSRPSTPSIEEIIEEKIFSVTTKEDSKVPKVKIRFEEKRPKSPNVSFDENVSKTDTTENKIPKMKIKLEDRLPKVIIENSNTELSGSTEEVQKTIPKMKIKKFKGALKQIMETQVLPISIPRMFIYTELENDEETALQILTRKEVSTSDKNLKSDRLNSIQGDQKTAKEADLKKIPKLKIKRQSSGCSIDSNRKRHSVSPIQSELKKVRKSSKVTELHDKKQKSSVASEHHDILMKLDTFSVEQSHESASSENVEYTSATEFTEFVRSEQTKSTGENINLTPEEIPKVIIKRASPSAEFKCELSKVRSDAIIKNKRWQPEVKLQRSWVLDCMAKDLNLDKLRLKLATPGSFLKKSLPPKELELGGIQVKNINVDNNQGEKKLFRSKSTSELLPSHGSFDRRVKDDIKQLNETDTTDSPKKLVTPKRCKSDLGSTFSKYSENSECKKKLRRNDQSNTIHSTSKPTLNYANDFANSSSIRFVQEADMVIKKHQAMEDLETDSNLKEIQSNNGAVDSIGISEGSPGKTLVENEISTPKINTLLRENETLCKSLVDLHLNSEILSGSTNTTNDSKSIHERFEKSKEVTKNCVNDSMMNGAQKVNDSNSPYSSTKCRDRIGVSNHSVIVKNTNVDSARKHTKSGKKHLKEIRNQGNRKGKAVENKNNGASAIENIPTNYINEEKTHQNTIDHTVSGTDNTKVPDKSVILEAPISIEPDNNVPKDYSDISSSHALNTLNNLETSNGENNVQKLDINDNSDDNVRQADDNNAGGENSVSNMNIVEQESTSALDGNVLIPPVNNDRKSSDSDAKDVQDPEAYIKLNNRSDEVMDSDGNFGKKFERSEESRKIIEILSASPSRSEHEVEIQFCPDVIEDSEICLYHEDAIPTQFELELEIMDNVVPDPLEVPMPRDNHPADEFHICSGDEAEEDSHRSSRILNNSGNSENLDNSKSEVTLPAENNLQACSISTYQRVVFAYPSKQDKTLSMDIVERNSSSNAFKETITGFNSNVEKSFNCADSLVEEVLAAKEKLRKYLEENKNESRFKIKSRPKTAAEKKQGSSFDLYALAASEDSFTKLENHSSSNFNTEANSSKQMDQNFSSSNNNDKLFQHQSKTEFKLNKIRSERKHSKGSNNDLIQKNYSSLPTSIQKYTNLMRIEEYSIPKHSSIDIKDRVELTKEETAISLKNSKQLIKSHSYSDERRKMPGLVNSKDSKCRSKSSRHDVNSKYVGRSKSTLLPSVAQESTLDSGQSEEKSVSDAAKHKYKSLKTSSDQNINSMSDKAKFKLYKIPRITKPTHSGSEKLSKELRESQSKEARMPILEPQVDLNGGLELSDLNSDREVSRSPPVITNQGSRTDYETTTRNSECEVSLNTEKEILSRQRTSFLQKDVLEATPSYGKETTVVDIVNDMAYHEKATIKHKRYCTLCERWFPTVTRYRRHLSGYQHRHTELTQRRTIHALFTLFTGRPCPRLQPPGVVRMDCEPGELTPLQIAVQGVTKESNKVDGNIKKPTRE